MTAAGIIIFTAIAVVWLYPKRFGAWIAAVRQGYEESRKVKP